MADSAVKIARDNMFIDTAVGAHLRALGSNYGVPPPKENPLDDELYRKLVQLLNPFQPKTQRRIVVQLLEILFGTKAEIIATGKRPWAIFCQTKCSVIRNPY